MIADHGALGRGDRRTSFNTLRDDVIPRRSKGTGLTAYVGGQTAAYIDLADRIGEKLPLVIVIVVALSFLLLMVAFRSILVPLTAGADEPALGGRRLRRPDRASSRRAGASS